AQPHEAEPCVAASVAVHDHLGGLHGGMRLKHAQQIAVANGVGQVAYIQLLAHGGPPKKLPGAPHTTPGRRRLAKYTQFNHMGQEKGIWKKALLTSPPWPDPHGPSSGILANL